MIDRIESFEETVSRLAGRGRSGSRVTQSAESLRVDWERRAAKIRATPIPVSYLKAQLSGSFLSRDFPYSYPDRKLRIMFDRECRFDFRDGYFCASHEDTTPLAWVRDGSLHVNLPGSPTFWVRKLRDCEAARRLVSDVKSKKIQGVSMRFHVTGMKSQYRDGQYDVSVASSVIIEHICAERDPVCPWTHIETF